MISQEEIFGVLRRQRPYLRKKYGVKRMGLFGSFSKGQQHKESDVDLLIEFEKPLGLEFMDLAEHIESLLKRKVDLLTPEGMNHIRLKKIKDNIEKGIVYV